MMNESAIASVTFFLAMLGYVGLTLAVLLAAVDRSPIWAARTAAPIILLHVALVWSFRYEWQMTQATRNGYLGFLIFHSALLLILASAFLRGCMGQTLPLLAFLAVTAGALGAVFRYEEVEVYRIPVILCAVAGFIGLGGMVRKALISDARGRRAPADRG